MGLVGNKVPLLRTIRFSSPSALVKLLPELRQKSNPTIREELSRRFLQHAPFFTPSQVVQLTKCRTAFTFNSALVERLQEIQLDSIGNLSVLELVELLHAGDGRLGSAIVARLEMFDLSAEIENEKYVALLVFGCRNLEINDNFRAQLVGLISKFACAFSSQSAAQVALAGGKHKFPISTKTGEEISERLQDTPRHMANAVYGFSRWPAIPSDIIFGLIKKIKYEQLNSSERAQVIAAMIARKLPVHKFYTKFLKDANSISDQHTLLLVQAATQIRNLQSPGLGFYLETLPRKFAGSIKGERLKASLLLTGYARARVPIPVSLRAELFACIQNCLDLKADVSDLSSVSRLAGFVDDREYLEICSLLVGRLEERLLCSELAEDADNLVNVLLALSRLMDALPQDPICQTRLARNCLHALAADKFSTLSSHRSVNAVYAVLKILDVASMGEADLAACRVVGERVISQELNDHLKETWQNICNALGIATLSV